MAMGKVVVAFDLDDTLYKEVDFVDSAFKAIASYLDYIGKGNEAEILSLMRKSFASGENPIDAVAGKCSFDGHEQLLVNIYRLHKPDIALDKATADVLLDLFKNYSLALITDGRSTTQRNKIEALGIGRLFQKCDIIISGETGYDKTCPDNFLKVQSQHEDAGLFVYVGDNPAKDFHYPNKLGWKTICLKDDGRNVHPQDIEVADDFRPQFTIGSISELPGLIDKIKNKI